MDFEDIPAAEEDEVVYSEQEQQEEVYSPPQEEEYSMPEPESQEAQESVYSMPEPESQEEDALTKFNREWNAKLDAKRQAEFEKEKKVRADSEEAKANWTTQRDIRLKAKKDSNRSEESVLQEQLESESENLKTWERVSKLIDAGETVEATKGSDTGRMRKLFIQLKSEPLEVTRAAAEAKCA